MAYCNRCGKSIEGQFMYCPDCGGTLKDENSRAEAGRKLPKIVGETHSGNAIPPGMPNVQQQVNPPEFQQRQYQGPPGFERQEHLPRGGEAPGKVGLMPTVIIIIGGLIAMVSAAALFRTSFMGFSTIMDMTALEDKYVYIWLIPLSGMLALLFGIIGYLVQKRQFALIIMMLGLVALIVPLIFAAHLSSEGDLSFGEVFYVTGSQAGFGSDFSNIFIGGFLGIGGGLMAAIGSILFLRAMNVKERRVRV